MDWVELTGKDGEVCWINLMLVVAMIRNEGDETTMILYSHQDCLEVRQTPKEILMASKRYK